MIDEIIRLLVEQTNFYVMEQTTRDHCSEDRWRDGYEKVLISAAAEFRATNPLEIHTNIDIYAYQAIYLCITYIPKFRLWNSKKKKKFCV